MNHCIVLKRWKKTVTSLIEKSGTPFIHKFRVIHIIEGDLQFLARLFYAKRIMRFAEENNLITDEQYGGRKNRMAQTAVLNKISYYNISHQTFTSCAFMDDDARACYNRIVTSLSSAECRQWGISHNIATFTNKFIETQQFYIRTAYGISQNSYSFDINNPIQGPGQGDMVGNDLVRQVVFYNG